MINLLEVTRNQLVSKSRGNKRFKKRLNSRVSTNSNDYNKIDMNKLFKQDILEVVIPVHGETDDYLVIISFEGVLKNLKESLQEQELNLRTIVRAITRAYGHEDIYLHCSCPDFKYRFNYWSTVNRYNSTDPEMRPAEITNPDDDLGSCCKHCLLVLNRSAWILKVASVINNYIRYMKLRNRRLYDSIIYPALYDENTELEPDEPIENQISMFDPPEEPEIEEEPVEEEKPDQEDESDD